MSPLFTVDCFTDRLGTGAPAAVCVLDGRWPATEWMQRVAAESKLPATAFIRVAAPDASLRWFGPRTELELCASGALAAVHVLSQHCGCGSTYELDTCAGNLAAHCAPDGWIRMDFPPDPPQPLPVPRLLAEALGAAPIAVARGRLDLLVELASADAVATLNPDLARLAALDARGVIVTAAGRCGSSGADFVSRFFAPGVGIDEDPVTGSAHCTLGAYWSVRLGKTSMTGAQLSARGGRVGVLLRDERVELSGQAVTVSR